LNERGRDKDVTWEYSTTMEQLEELLGVAVKEYTLKES
jgi:hypothetical protein